MPRRLRCTLKRLPSFLVFASLSTLGVATPSEAQPAVGLDNFDSCRDFVKFERRRALPIVARLEDQRRKWAEERRKKAEELGQPLPGAGAPALPSPPALVKAPASPQKFSTTNVQEPGVDEPDMVKADGSHIFAIEDGRLQAIDSQAPSPRVVGSLALPGAREGSEMLLFGNRVFVISRVFKREPPPKPVPGTGLADDGMSISAPMVQARGATHMQIKEVDVDDPGAMKVVRTLEVKGRYVSARQVGDSARVVISSSVPLPDSRAALARTGVEDWMPSYVLKGRRSGGTRHRPLVPCDEIEQPAKFSGRDMLSVLTLDLSGGLRLADSDSVMTDGDTVYASQNSLYVATERWFDELDENAPELGVVSTSIHRFDISSPRQTEYRGSGSVRGYLLSQFSMSEDGGFLRVASTDEDPDFSDPGDDTQSRVTVLDTRGGQLHEVGKVAGIGHGESIYAVRFVGDVGYVVTFRKTDPLFTVDLATPDRPKVVGELKLRGYSAYLHPIDDGLLIGIGQAADESGQEEGSQISLFDASDPSKPIRLDQRTIAPDSYSNVEWDHHAFLYWPQRALTVIPLEAYDDGRFTGAVGFRVTRAGGIEEAGRLTQQRGRWAAEVDRTVVVGDRLFAISYRGARVTDLDTLSGGDWVPFRRD